jgi:hypothetical protein
MNPATRPTLVVFAALFAVIGCLLATSESKGAAASPSASQEALYNGWLAESAMPLPKATIKVQPRTCPEFHATLCAHPGRSVIVIPDPTYLTEVMASGRTYGSTREIASERFGLYHEVGHVIDLGEHRGPRRYRRAFSRLIGGDGPNADFELLADAYALCSFSRTQLPALGVNAISFYGYKPSVTLHRKVCRVLAAGMR